MLLAPAPFNAHEWMCFDGVSCDALFLLWGFTSDSMASATAAADFGRRQTTRATGHDQQIFALQASELLRQALRRQIGLRQCTTAPC